jgi:putative tryptophan/tyrosine transport system substrate-binding protein
MNRKLNWLFAVLLLSTVQPAEAQQPKKVPRIGALFGSSPEPEKKRLAAFHQGLADLGYFEGKNILIDYRYAEGKLDRIPSLVSELLELKVDVLFVPFLAGIRPAKQMAKTTPIVIVTQVDPVAAGVVDSLARPGGNITGIGTLGRDLSGKRLELLQEVIPGTSRVGVLWDADAPGPAIAFKEYEAAARVLKIKLQSLEIRGPNPDLDGAFQSAVKGGANTFIAITNPVLRRYATRIAEMAIKNRLPAMYESSHYAENGGLISYSAADLPVYRRAAIYVDKILKGAKPADLPVEQPTKFELVINLKTAKQIGLTIPPNVLARADRVIK